MSDITEEGPVYGLLAARVMIPSGSSLIPIDLFYPNQVEIDVQQNEIPFEGGEKRQVVNAVSGANVTLTCAKHDADAIQALFNKTKLAGGGAGEWRMSMGSAQDVAGISCGLQYDLAAKDESVNPNVAYRLRYYWYKGTLTMMIPQTAGYQAQNAMVLNFNFQRTTVDAAGQPLAGVNPSGSGDLYEYARVAL